MVAFCIIKVKQMTSLIYHFAINLRFIRLPKSEDTEKCNLHSCKGRVPMKTEFTISFRSR